LRVSEIGSIDRGGQRQNTFSKVNFVKTFETRRAKDNCYLAKPCSNSSEIKIEPKHFRAPDAVSRTTSRKRSVHSVEGKTVEGTGKVHVQQLTSMQKDSGWPLKQTQ
jgi:hypothetical protein